MAFGNVSETVWGVSERTANKQSTSHGGADIGNRQGKDFGGLLGVFEGCLGKSFPCKNLKENIQKTTKNKEKLKENYIFHSFL